VERYAESGAENADKVRAAWNAALGVAADGRYADAIKLAGRLKPIVQGRGASPAVDEGADNWPKVEPTLTAMVDALSQSGHPNAAKIQMAWDAALGAAEAGKFADALAVAKKLKPILDAATGQATAAANTAGPSGGAEEAAAAQMAAGGEKVDTSKPSAGEEEAAKVIPKGTVKKRAFMIDRWTKIPVELKINLDTLVAAIPAAVPWEDPAEIQALVDGKLVEKVEAMQTEIQNGFDADVTSGDGSYAETRAALENMKKKSAPMRFLWRSKTMRSSMAMASWSLSKTLSTRSRRT
jgi:hypothetical protein